MTKNTHKIEFAQLSTPNKIAIVLSWVWGGLMTLFFLYGLLIGA